MHHLYEKIKKIKTVDEVEFINNTLVVTYKKGKNNLVELILLHHYLLTPLFHLIYYFYFVGRLLHFCGLYIKDKTIRKKYINDAINFLQLLQ